MNLKFTATNRAEPPSAPATVPATELRATERAGAREHLLARGKELAARTILAYERWARCPFNAQEAAQVRGLQKCFEEWEHAAKVQCPGLDTAALFPDSRLRPFRREPSISDLARARRTPSVLEAHFVSVSASKRSQERTEETDTGMWGAAGPGI